MGDCIARQQGKDKGLGAGAGGSEVQCTGRPPTSDNVAARKKGRPGTLCQSNDAATCRDGADTCILIRRGGGGLFLLWMGACVSLQAPQRHASQISGGVRTQPPRISFAVGQKGNKFPRIFHNKGQAGGGLASSWLFCFSKKACAKGFCQGSACMWVLATKVHAVRRRCTQSKVSCPMHQKQTPSILA